MASAVAPRVGTTGFSRILQYSDILMALALGLIVGMLVIPIPEWLLDVLIATNISVGLVILLVAMYITEPLQFSSFPALLLITTLFRLALNVSASRLILLHAHAGSIIESFGNFVVGGNYVVGIVIFLILIVIQFVVITSGAGRVAEVAARFTLDAMPGKQMSIDADLNAGMIDDATARQRRRTIEQEADFYGAMDGASKFVKGDAIAGVIIIIVNILGGLCIGVFQLGMPVTEALRVYPLLTIGDGLVSQIPALLISTATGLIVTRSGSSTNLGRDVATQILANPRALAIVSGFLLVLAIVPGLPKLPLIIMSAILGAGFLFRSRTPTEPTEQLTSPQSRAEEPEDVMKLMQVDRVEVEIGYGLIDLTDAQSGGTLLGRVTLIRRQIALRLGIIIPILRIRDNAQLPPNEYVIKLRGVQVARGEVRPKRLMAMNPGLADGELAGIPSVEPAFGLPATWITPDEQEHAEALGYTVVDPTSVIITHLSEVFSAHAASILSREDVQTLLDHVREASPTVVSELVPNVLSVGDLHRVLQALLRERVSIRDLVAILESIADHAHLMKDPDVLAEHARRALGRQIASEYAAEGRELRAIVLSPATQLALIEHLTQTDRGPVLQIDPSTSQRLLRMLNAAMERVSAAGDQPVLVCPDQLRLCLRRLTERSLSSLAVLSFGEIGSSYDVVVKESVDGLDG